MSKYKIPDEYYFRVHHIRPRFKNDVENVLFFMANEISKLDVSKRKVFNESLDSIIGQYPGNGSKTKKTIQKCRTEISSLFGLVEFDEENAWPSRMAKMLSESQDLVEFFRYFLYYFQYPGGHLKPYETCSFLKAGIKFKPVAYVLAVMMEGQKLSEGNKFGLTKAEATHCIFNDLRVTRDQRSPLETAHSILKLRKQKIDFDQTGDVVRYAGDILDYMELADLVTLRPNYQYYPNTINFETIQTYIDSLHTFFPVYEQLYAEVTTLSLDKITATQFDWVTYVNDRLDASLFKTNILSLIEDAEGCIGGENVEDDGDKEFLQAVLETLQTRIESKDGIKTKEIGDVGEAIVIEHEKARLASLDRNDLLHLIKKIPETFAVGYDISSYDGQGDLRRYIEVKTTISRGKLASCSFQMTPSEWSCATTSKTNYYVYRLMISSGSVKLFIIDDPVGKYKSDLLDMRPSEAATIRYSEASGYWESLSV